jgi:hypothetical protein
MRISGPAIHRNLVHVFLDVYEARVANVRGQVPDLVEALAKALAGLVENVAPLGQDVVGRQCAVVAFELDRHFELVEVAAWLEVLVDLGVQVGPGVDGAVEGADVDEVKGARVCPGEGDVVDFEFAVWRCEGGLDGGEVYASDFGTGMFW